MIRILSLLSLAVFSLAVVTRAADSTPARPRVTLAGDSTVTDTAGWGAAFAKRLTPDAECVNLSSGGQSTKSFSDGGRWKKVIESKPAFILIQFGHNDMPGKGPHRETNPETTYRENLLRFVKEAKDIGAQPIIVTSMTRRIFDGAKIRGELKPYADAARKVATDEKVPMVDLFVRSVELHEKLGPTASDEFNPPGKDGATDRTHLNAKGAEVMSGIIVEELRKVSPELAKHLK
jgi:lysophospholipase L1-like esterase